MPAAMQAEEHVRRDPPCRDQQIRQSRRQPSRCLDAIADGRRAGVLHRLEDVLRRPRYQFANADAVGARREGDGHAMLQDGNRERFHVIE